MNAECAHRSYFSFFREWGRPIFAMLLVMMLFSALDSQTVIGKITRPGMKPTAVAVYEAGKKVFIADQASKEILIYSDSTLKQVGAIDLASIKVTHIIVDEKYGKAYCLGESPDWTNETIVVIDAVRNKLVRYIELPFQRTFADMAHDSNLHKIYGLCVGGFIQIDVATDGVTKIPGINGNPLRMMAVNPGTHDVYISNSQYRAFDVVNGVTLAHSKILNLTGVGLGINPLENKAYIGCYNWFTGTYRLGVYDRDTGKHQPLNPANDALKFAFNPNSNRMYTSSELERVTSIIEGATDAVFNMPFQSPTGAPEVRHATNHVYYAGMDYIAILNDTTQLVEIIPIENTDHGGRIIQEVAVNQKTGRVYVINDGLKLNYVTVIQDEEPMSRPLVYAGECDQYGVGLKVHVFDPGSKSFVSAIWPPYGMGYHSAVFKPGGGRYYIPIQQMGFKIDTVAEYAGFRSFMSLDPIRELKTEGAGSIVPVVSPDGETIYVTNTNTDDVSAIDGKSGKLIKRITVGDSPLGMDITKDGKTLVVANKGDGTISVIDMGKSAEDVRIAVGDSPWGVAVNPSGRWAYVANSASATISVVDLKNKSVFVTIPVGSGPRWLACSPDGRRVWVSNFSGRSVSVVDPCAKKAVKTISMEGSPEGLCFLPDGKEVYIGTGTKLAVIETSNFVKTEYTPPKDMFGFKPIVSAAVGDPASRFAGTVASAGVPLKGAMVEAYRNRIKMGQAATNLYGDYAIPNLPPGRYDIKISKSGYVSQQRTLDVQAGQTKLLSLNLKKS